MATQTVVRYTTKDTAAAAENRRLIDAVFAEIAATDLPGLRSYNVSLLEDGLSFVHVAVIDSDPNPLTGLASFRAFSSTVGERAVSAPVVVTGDLIAHLP